MMSVSAGVSWRSSALDQLGRDRVEGRSRLVEQEHLGTDGERPGQAQQLLLAPREPERRVAQPVLDRVPQPDLAEPLLGHHVELLALGDPVRLHAGHHVVADRHRKRVGRWKSIPTRRRSDSRSWLGAQMLSPSKVTSPSNLKPAHLVVHPVDGAQEGRLPATGRTDERGDGAPAERDVDVREDALCAERQRKALRTAPRRPAGRGRGRGRPGSGRSRELGVAGSPRCRRQVGQVDHRESSVRTVVTADERSANRKGHEIKLSANPWQFRTVRRPEPSGLEVG